MKIVPAYARHIYLIIICFIAGLCLLSAGNPSDSVTIYFRQGRSVFDGNYRDNAASMNSFIEMLRVSPDAIDSVIINGYVSPEGHYLGDRLPRKRSNNVAQYIIRHSGINPGLVAIRPIGVDWGLLRRLIAETPGVPYRQSLLRTIDKYPEWIPDSKGRIVDGRNKRLMEVAGGRPYLWLMDNIFPDLRTAVAISVRWKQAQTSEPPQAPEPTEVHEAPQAPELPQLPQLPETPQAPRVHETPETPEIPETLAAESPDTLAEFLPAPPKPFYMALKTNMLYDAALVPNLAAEFYIGKNLSVYGDWMYAWWDRDPRHRYWRIYGGDLGMRWWFGQKAHDKPLTGHHLGIFAGVLTFDFELGDHGYMGGKPGGTLWDRCLVNSGIEYGYSLPVAKRLNIDFSIALGFLGGNYIKYFPFDNEYFKEKEYKMRFVGPTKAEVSLVWLIGRGNVNDRKGGDR